METITTVSAIGTLYTFTDFKRKGGDTIRIRVSFEQERTVSNQYNYYTTMVYIKPFRCRNFVRQVHFKPLDFISEQELYEAYFNHWNNLNPIKMFGGGQKNGHYYGFSVEGKNPDFNDIHALRGVNNLI